MIITQVNNSLNYISQLKNTTTTTKKQQEKRLLDLEKNIKGQSQNFILILGVFHWLKHRGNSF